MRLGQGLRLGKASVEDQAAHLVEIRSGLAVDLGIRAASPERILVELQAFARHAPEHHGAQSPIADRQRLDPFAGGSLVPELQVRHRPPARNRSPSGEKASTLSGW